MFFLANLVNQTPYSFEIYKPIFFIPQMAPSIEIWDGLDVVRTRAVIRERLQCIKYFKNCLGAKHISFKNSMFGNSWCGLNMETTVGKQTLRNCYKQDSIYLQ